MSAILPKAPSEFRKIPHARLAIIGSLWHSDCIDSMIDRAHGDLLSLEVRPDNISIHRVPGSLEIPFAARILFEEDPKLDAILAFGVLLKGATSHEDTIMHNVVNGFRNVSERFGKPVINEVIAVSKIEEARERSGNNNMNKGTEAVFAVSELLHWWAGIKDRS